MIALHISCEKIRYIPFKIKARPIWGPYGTHMGPIWAVSRKFNVPKISGEFLNLNKKIILELFKG